MPGRRIGAADSKARGQLLDAAERLMLDEGYAAVTSRRVGITAGLTPQLVHYYFRSMDELFLEMFRRRADEGLESVAAVLDAGPSLQELWTLMSAGPGAVLNLEFAALANHRKAVRAEVARYAERYREMLLAAIERALADAGVDSVPAIVLLVAATGISQVTVLEERLGMTTGHAETAAFVKQLIDGLGAP